MIFSKWQRSGLNYRSYVGKILVPPPTIPHQIWWIVLNKKGKTLKKTSIASPPVNRAVSCRQSREGSPGPFGWIPGLHTWELDNDFSLFYLSHCKALRGSPCGPVGLTCFPLSSGEARKQLPYVWFFLSGEWLFGLQWFICWEGKNRNDCSKRNRQWKPGSLLLL